MKPPKPQPEISLATQGRAKAKGTGLPWVDPRHDMYSPLYAQAKSGFIDTRGMLTTPEPMRADDTAAPLTNHLNQWLSGQLGPPPALSGPPSLADLLRPLFR